MEFTCKLREQHLFFLGAGSMSEAIIKGICGAQMIPAQYITVSNRKNFARLQELQQKYGVRTTADKRKSASEADIIILAVKPFDLMAALHELAPAISDRQLIISVAAGVATEVIEDCLGDRRSVIRAMPNTSSFVQASATALCRGRHVSDAQLALAHQLFSAIGISVDVTEDQMDAVTGLSGSGPAYLYYVIEALLDAGQACGLSADTSRELLLQTIQGAVKMVQETGEEPAELRRRVTSPNGTTMAGITALDQYSVRDAFQLAVQRATQRGAEMGRQVMSRTTEAAHPACSREVPV